jgi:hypothetical protein
MVHIRQAIKINVHYRLSINVIKNGLLGIYQAVNQKYILLCSYKNDTVFFLKTQELSDILIA